MDNAAKIKSHLLIVLILAAALALRLYCLEQYSLGYDEAAEALSARTLSHLPPLSKVLDDDYITRNHEYSHLYSYGFVSYWQGLFGSSDFALRLSSVLLSLLSIVLLYLIGKDIFGKTIATLAAFLFAISPLHLCHAQELRPYMLSCFLNLGAVFALVKIIRHNQQKYWFAYVLAMTFSLYTYAANYLLLTPFLAFFILDRDRRQLYPRFIPAHLAILVLLTPSLLSLYKQLVFFFHHTFEAPFSDFPIWAGKDVGLKQLLCSFKNFSIGYNTSYYSAAGKWATFVYFIILGLGVFQFRKNAEKRLLLYCLFVPPLALFAASAIKTCYVDRYFFPSYPFFALLAAAGLNSLNRLGRIIFYNAIILVAILNVIGIKNYYLNHLPYDGYRYVGVTTRQDIRPAVKFIIDNYRKGDRLMHTCKNTVFPLKFYMKKQCRDADLLREADKGTVVFHSDLLKHRNLYFVDYNLSHPYTFLPKDYHLFQYRPENNERLWLVFSNWEFAGFGDVLYQTVREISAKFTGTQEFKEFDGVYVYLFGSDVGSGERKPQQQPPD